MREKHLTNNMDKEYKFCVVCNTYNQSPYIKDALDGFVIQKTTFPYVCVIVDDASTDGNIDVISGYLNDHFNVKSFEETEDYECFWHQKHFHIFFFSTTKSSFEE